MWCRLYLILTAEHDRERMFRLSQRYGWDMLFTDATLHLWVVSLVNGQKCFERMRWRHVQGWKGPRRTLRPLKMGHYAVRKRQKLTYSDVESYTRRTETLESSSVYTILSYAPYTRMVTVGYRANQLTNWRSRAQLFTVLSSPASREIPHIFGSPKVQCVFK